MRGLGARVVAAGFLATIVGLAVVAFATGGAAHEVPFLPCPVLASTGVPCPGCGMTRACVALASGDARSAWSLHPFAFLLVPLAVAVMIAPEQVRAAWVRVPRVGRGIAIAALLACCVGRWVAMV